MLIYAVKTSGPVLLAHAVEHGTHLAAGQHHRQALRLAGARHPLQTADLDPQDIPIKKENRIECLILSNRRDIALLGQSGQVGCDLGLSHLERVTFVVEEDELPDPVAVGVFGTAAVVTDTDDGPDLVQQTGLFHVPSQLMT